MVGQNCVVMPEHDAVAKAHDGMPRAVYERHLDELKDLFAKGVPSAH